MVMKKNEVRDLYNKAALSLIGRLATEVEVDELYDTYLIGVEFTECENEIIFEKGASGELDISLRPTAVFPISFPGGSKIK